MVTCKNLQQNTVTGAVTCAVTCGNMDRIYSNLIDVMPDEIFCRSGHQLLEIIPLKANLNLEFQCLTTFSSLIFSLWP